MKILTGMVGMAWLAAAGWTQAAVTIENNRLKTDSAPGFVTGTANLTPESEAVLEEIKDYLTAKTYLSLVRVEGHVGPDGDESELQALSEARALAVVRWLVSRGIECERLIAVGFGSGKPVVANDGPERARNTRVEMAPAALRGRLIGGMPADGGGKVAGDACAGSGLTPPTSSAAPSTATASPPAP